MRLLHLDSLGKLILSNFHGKPIPPYAILSHRWSDSEILLEDIASGTYKDKREGYRKLEFCATQAAIDNLRYFWIDTCCIDKWNLNERSNAINSMFRWYKNAKRCYVFLSDVSLSNATNRPQHCDWEVMFGASAWFTRGWTLQELIAPLSVEFFSCEGWRIGEKTSLDQLIHKVTDIPLAALHNCPLDQFTTLERERWAKKRRTSEEEDIVYCLLGILGISLPTSYGEGQESARSRLQDEIKSAGSAPSVIPFARNRRFVSQESRLAELEAKLFSNNETTTAIAILGSGGTGKSQLALEFAHTTKHNNKHCSVFWVDASDKDSLYQSYARVAQKLGVSGRENEQADMKQLVRDCVSEISTTQCLLIFDNADDATLRSLSTTEVVDLADFVPRSPLCSVIFTTTSSDAARTLAPQCVVAPQKLTPDTARGMLQNYLARPLLCAEGQEADFLLRDLSCLPLAVVQAAAYINNTGATVQEYRSRLGSRLDELAELATGYVSSSSEATLQCAGGEDPVATTLFLSLNQISRDNASAADSLFLAACLDRKDIPIDLLEAASPQAREDAVRTLDKFALVTRRPAESAFDVHRLVHQALRKRLQVQGQLTEWTQRTIAQLDQVLPNNYHGARSTWRRLLPHALYALSHSLSDQEGTDKMNLIWKCATALYNDGRYKESENLFAQALEMHQRVLGADHANTLTLMANLALTYRNQGWFDKAQEIATQAMEKRSIALGADDPSTLESMASVALIYLDRRKLEVAEELGLQVMRNRIRVLGSEHPDTLSSMENLATTYADLQRWEEAEQLNMEVVEARTNALGSEHRDTLSSIGNQALIYVQQGRSHEAEQLCVQVVDTLKQVLGEEHPVTLRNMGNLGFVYGRQKRWKEAGELVSKVIDTSKRVLGEKHPDILTSMSNMVWIYCHQGRWKEAEELITKGMDTSMKVLGERHPETLTSMANIAATYWHWGRQEAAEELTTKVVAIRKKVLGEQHPDTLRSMTNLSSMYKDQGRLEEAEELYTKVMNAKKKVLGEKHPDTLESMANLARTYQHQRRWKEAVELRLQITVKRATSSL